MNQVFRVSKENHLNPGIESLPNEIQLWGHKNIQIQASIQEIPSYKHVRRQNSNTKNANKSKKTEKPHAMNIRYQHDQVTSVKCVAVYFFFFNDKRIEKW